MKETLLSNFLFWETSGNNLKINSVFSYFRDGDGIYRVFIKEGHKVNAYYTYKICLLGASKRFILTTTYEHLFIYNKNLKFLL